jgi:hypothetical protein
MPALHIHVSACHAAVRRRHRPDVECLDLSDHLVSDVHRRREPQLLAHVHRSWLQGQLLVVMLM